MIARFLASLLVVLGAGFTAQAADDAVVPASLNDVRTQPRAYLKTTFEFEGRFSNHGEIFQVFFTKFDDHLYSNFAAWDVRNKLADYDQNADRSALLYLNRHSGEQMETLFKLAKYQRFRATAKVESIFGGRAFIEVIDLIALDEQLEPSAHAKKALVQCGGCTKCAGGVAALGGPGEQQDDQLTGDPTSVESAVPEENAEENLVAAETE